MYTIIAQATDPEVVYLIWDLILDKKKIIMAQLETLCSLVIFLFTNIIILSLSINANF